ncbi:hypothetical protein ANTRET_LOCUS3826 [Anthophora retusa]
MIRHRRTSLERHLRQTLNDQCPKPINESRLIDIKIPIGEKRKKERKVWIRRGTPITRGKCNRSTRDRAINFPLRNIRAHFASAFSIICSLLFIVLSLASSTLVVASTLQSDLSNNLNMCDIINQFAKEKAKKINV